MHLQNIVQEQDQPLTTLQVYHRRLKIPKESYVRIVSDFTDPWDERASQYFVEQYLQELSDPGIVGMVRQELTDTHVLLDAAVRYPHST